MIFAQRLSKGFTLIELMMVIVITGTLVALAVPQFLDFRKEAKVGALKQNLAAMRSSFKTHTQQAMLRCGVIDPATFLVTGSQNFYWSLMRVLSRHNDITSGETDVTLALNKVCTTAQIPDPADRIWLNIALSETPRTFSGGVDTGAVRYIPINPFVDYTFTGSIISAGATDHSVFVAQGGPCGLADEQLADFGTISHWLFDAQTGEIWAGTHTPGINECNF
jgi:prepilin-type N-terminal cleavage/methylation domain-containing protein